MHERVGVKAVTHWYNVKYSRIPVCQINTVHIGSDAFQTVVTLVTIVHTSDLWVRLFCGATTQEINLIKSKTWRFSAAKYKTLYVKVLVTIQNNLIEVDQHPILV